MPTGLWVDTLNVGWVFQGKGRLVHHLTEPVRSQLHLERNRLVLTCMAEGSWPLEFKWIHNGSEITRFSLEYRALSLPHGPRPVVFALTFLLGVSRAGAGVMGIAGIPHFELVMNAFLRLATPPLALPPRPPPPRRPDPHCALTHTAKYRRPHPSPSSTVTSPCCGRIATLSPPRASQSCHARYGRAYWTISQCPQGL
ncbi:hypothetical protein COCON_G00023410 [Conger conger]|uniref:Ig-like domain-containing protein n=1 Tax=Conger conger TaxID=82655 RepID=A0A9Q1DX75_CONCO|nr:hypothetical protein COCON_G00023410 [Conger conger]